MIDFFTWLRTWLRTHPTPCRARQICLNDRIKPKVAQLNLQNQNLSHNQNLNHNPNQVVIPLNRTKSGESNYSINNRQDSSRRKKKKMATPTNSVPNIVVVKTNIRGSKSLSLMNPAVKKVSFFFLKILMNLLKKSPFFILSYKKSFFS